jgi:hypothetical protein
MSNEMHSVEGYGGFEWHRGAFEDCPECYPQGFKRQYQQRPSPAAYEQRISALEAQLAEAKAVLKLVEWNAGDTPLCPACARPRTFGHAPDCRLAKVLENAP